LGEDSAAPYNWTWNNVAAGNYSLTARVVYDAGSSLDSSPVNLAVTLTSTNLPAPWQTADIGSGIAVGSASVSNGTYSVKGAGNLSGMADNFRFVYQTLTGDGEIRANLQSLQNTGPNGCIGVMMRESLASGAKYNLIGVSTVGRYRLQNRASTGANSTAAAGGGATAPNIWLRLVRSGSSISIYTSTDGGNWAQVTSVPVTMATNIYLGLAVASGTTNTLNTAAFGNVTVVP